jgi:hypothetical protein
MQSDVECCCITMYLCGVVPTIALGLCVAGSVWYHMVPAAGVF